MLDNNNLLNNYLQIVSLFNQQTPDQQQTDKEDEEEEEQGQEQESGGVEGEKEAW